ncbi:TPA: hypothetical protein SIA26_001783 [Aeromonas bestiarum]|nr:hypothetical protein [Aeromonas bestiarum]
MNSHPVQELLSSLVDPVRGQLLPKGVAVVHYGPDGVSVATRGQADYSTQAGGGLAIRYSAQSAGGTPYSESQLVVDTQGCVLHSTTQLMTPEGNVRQVVSGAYDGLQLTAAGTPAEGVVQLSVSDANGQLTHRAQMIYSDELYESYQLSSLAGGQVTGGTTISYAQAQMAGTRLVGGVLAVNRTDAKGQRAFSAQSYLSLLGVPYKVMATRYAQDGVTVDGYVDSDYSAVVFDALRQVNAGQLVVRTTSASGQPESASVLLFKAGRLVSTKALEGCEQDIVPNPVLLAPAPAPWTPSRPADRSVLRRRIDGSLLQKREDWFTQPGQSGTPRRSQVTLYARDGTRAIRLTDVDYAGTHFDSAGNPTGGTVVSTQYQAGVRSSTACVAY